MHYSSKRVISSLFFLLAFLSFKVVDAHAFSHEIGDEDESHCELCLYINTSEETTPFVGQPFFEIEEVVYIYVETNNFNSGYVVPLESIASPDYFFNKPPPYLLA